MHGGREGVEKKKDNKIWKMTWVVVMNEIWKQKKM